MTPSRVLLALLVMLVAVLTALPARAQKPSAEPPAPALRADRPTYRPGDRWIRSDGVFELIRIEGDAYVFSAGTADEIRLSKDLMPAFYAYGQPAFEFTPPPRIDWPLRVGKAGSQVGTFKPRYGPPYPAELRWTVTGFEEVDVPAGKFQTFRLDFVVKPRQSTNFGARSFPSSLAPVRFRLWYAPAIRQHVKADGALGFELVAFDPGDTEPLNVTVMAPKDQARLSPDDELVLVGRITGGKGVRSFAVTVNAMAVGSEVVRGEPKRAIVLKLPLPLRDGKNVVLVTATDPQGTSSQEVRTLFYSAPVTVPLPAAGTPARVNREYVRLAVPVAPSKGSYCSVAVAVKEIVQDSFLCADAREGMGEAKLRLEPGENVIRLRFTDAGEQRVEERTIIFDPSVPVSTQAASTEPSAEDPRVAAERQRREEEQRLAEERRLAEEQRAAEERRKQAEAQRAAERHRLEQERLAREQRQREEEQRVAEERRRREAERQRAAEEQRKREEGLRLAALAPLRVILTSPADQARVEHETVTLAGLVSGGKGITGVVTSLNGVDIGRQDQKTPSPSVALSVPVTLREGQNTLVVTATEIDGTITQEARTVHFERIVPLTVAVRFPTDQMRVADAASLAAAVVTSSKGIAKVAVTVNGAEIHQQAERTPAKSVLVTVPVQFRPGVNAVVVSATEADGTTRQETRTVVYTPPAVAVPSPAPPPPRRERWAVVIGVGEYEHPGIPRLRYPVADADAMYQTLIGAGGFKKENVLLLTDRSPRKPTLRNIKWALGTFLARSAHKDDTVVIFFAGHGAPEVDSRGLERDGLAKYLVPSDADPDDLFATALPMDDLQTIFARIESERLVAFLDACYSGAAGGRTFMTKKSRVISVDETFLDRLTRGKGRAIVTASRTSEVSIELDDLKHGLFTYYLVEGLKGAADRNGDGVVTLQELYEYVEQQVSRRSRIVGGNQHPVMKGELEGVLPLMQLRNR